MRAFVLALLDTSALSGLVAMGRPTVTSNALNFLIYQQFSTGAKTEHKRSKILAVHPPPAVRRDVQAAEQAELLSDNCA